MILQEQWGQSVSVSPSRFRSLTAQLTQIGVTAKADLGPPPPPQRQWDSLPHLSNTLITGASWAYHCETVTKHYSIVHRNHNHWWHPHVSIVCCPGSVYHTLTVSSCISGNIVHTAFCHVFSILALYIKVQHTYIRLDVAYLLCFL